VNIHSSILTEFKFFTSRSGGKGGQHVNKTESKVELSFNITSSRFLTDEEKKLLLEKLKNKIDTDGNLHLYESGDRSQHANKEKLIKKTFKLLQAALIKPKKRKPTRISVTAKKKRRKSKETHSELKKLRQRPRDY
jgi:ribosome-associated protein